MKKVLFIVAVTLVSSTLFAQELDSLGIKKININNLVGYWKPNEQATQLFFWKDDKDNLQMQEISETSGDALDLISLKIKNNKVIVVTTFAPNNYTVESIYSFLDEKTLVCIMQGETNSALIYKKVK